MFTRYVPLLTFLAFSYAHAQDDPLGNWFNDPFFQIAADIEACPQPIGPRIPQSQMREQAHQRIERGTSCWLAHTCEKPNAYAYDAEIATAIRDLVAARPQLLAGSLWITVQRKLVWIDGCSAPGGTSSALEAAIRALNNVDAVLVRAKPLSQ